MEMKLLIGVINAIFDNALFCTFDEKGFSSSCQLGLIIINNCSLMGLVIRDWFFIFNFPKQCLEYFNRN